MFFILEFTPPPPPPHEMDTPASAFFHFPRMSQQNRMSSWQFRSMRFGCRKSPGGIAPNQVIARSEFEVHREIYTE